MGDKTRALATTAIVAALANFDFTISLKLDIRIGANILLDTNAGENEKPDINRHEKTIDENRRLDIVEEISSCSKFSYGLLNCCKLLPI